MGNKRYHAQHFIGTIKKLFQWTRQVSIDLVRKDNNDEQEDFTMGKSYLYQIGVFTIITQEMIVKNEVYLV